MLRRVTTVIALLSVLSGAAVTGASAAGSTSLTLNAGSSPVPVDVTVIGASTSGVLARQLGRYSPYAGNGIVHLSGGTTTALPTSFIDDFDADVNGSFVVSVRRARPGSFAAVVFYDVADPARQGSAPFSASLSLLAAAPDGWVEYARSTGKVDYVRPTGSGDNVPVTRSTLTTLPLDDGEMFADANATGLLLSSNCSGVRCGAASVLRFFPFDGSPATVLSDPAAAWNTVGPVSSQAPGSLAKATCPSPDLCLALDGMGGLSVTTNAAAPSPTWTAFSLGDKSLTEVACATASLCLVSDSDGNVRVSTSPATADSWAISGRPLYGELTGLSCAAPSLCVAVDSSGFASVTTNPTGGAASWSQESLLGAAGLNAVSCGAATLCAALSYGGEVLVSSTPTDLASWSLRASHPGAGLRAVSCSGTSWCAAVGDSGQIVGSSSPTTAWPAPVAIEGWSFLQSIACRSSSSCLVLDGGTLRRSATPLDGTSWLSEPSPIANTNGLGCGAATCVATTDGGTARTSTDGGATWGSAVLAAAPFFRAVTAIRCTSATACLAFDDGGSLLTSSDAGVTWSAATALANAADSPRHLECPSPSTCIAIVGYDSIITSTSPTVAASWTAPARAGAGSPSDVSCPSVALCVVTDLTGSVTWSTNAFDATPVWSAPHVVGVGLSSLDCPSTTLCVATDPYTADLYVTTTPGSASPWVTRALGGTPFTSVACPSTTQCLASRESGIMATAAPLDGPWTSVQTGFEFRTLTCPTTTLCLAAGPDTIIASTAPMSPGSWGASAFVGIVRDVHCQSSSLCLIGSAGGMIRRSTTPAATRGLRTHALGVDSAGNVAWAGNDGVYSSVCTSEVLRLTTSSPAVTGRSALDECIARPRLAVTATRTAWITDGSLRLAPSAGGVPTSLAGPWASGRWYSQAGVASDGTSLYAARQDTVATDGVYALADGTEVPVKLPGIGGAEPTAMQGIALSPGRVAYTDNSADPVSGDLWRTWDRSLSNAPDGLTAGTPSLVAPGRDAAVTISGRRTVHGAGTSLMLRTGATPPEAFSTATDTSDFQRVTLSGTRVLFRKYGSGGTAPWYLYDAATQQTKQAATATAWADASLSGRYIAAITYTGQVQRIDTRTWATDVISAAPSLSAGELIGSTRVAIAGSRIAWSIEIDADGFGPESRTLRYIESPGSAVQTVPLVTGQGLDFALSRQYLVYPTSDRLHLTAHRFSDGASIAMNATVAAKLVRYCDCDSEADRPPAADGNVVGYQGSDGFAHVEQLPAAGGDAPALLSGATLPSFTSGGGRAWSFDQVFSAPLTSCSVSIKQGTAVVRTLPCDPADMAVGEATATWDGRNTAGSASPLGSYTWTLTAAGADGAVRNDDLSASPVTGPLVVAAPTKVLKITAPANTSGYFTVQFDHDVYAGSSANVRFLFATNGTTALGASRTCLSSAGAVVPCTGPFRSMRVKPTADLVPGDVSRIQVNPTGSATLLDAGRTPVASYTSAAIRVLTADDPTFRQAWGSIATTSAVGGRYAVENRTGATFTATFTGTGVRYWYVKGPDGGRVKVTIDGVAKTAALDQYASTRAYKKYVTYSGLTNATHTLTVTVLPPVTATRKVGTVDAISTATATCSTATGCTQNPTGSRWATTAVTGGRAVVSDVAGATVSRSFVGTGFSLYRLLGPGQGKYVLYIDGTAVTLNNYATTNALSAYTRTGLANGIHFVTVKVLHQAGKTGTAAYAVTLDRLVAR